MPWLSCDISVMLMLLLFSFRTARRTAPCGTSSCMSSLSSSASSSSGSTNPKKRNPLMRRRSRYPDVNVTNLSITGVWVLCSLSWGSTYKKIPILSHLLNISIRLVRWGMHVNVLGWRAVISSSGWISQRVTSGKGGRALIRIACIASWGTR